MSLLAGVMGVFELPYIVAAVFYYHLDIHGFVHQDIIFENDHENSTV